MKEKTRPLLKKILKAAVFLFILAAVGTAVIFGINAYVKSFSSDKLISPEAASEKKADCILILGCRVNDTSPSPMLQDRLDTGIDLYFSGAAPKLLMSGDHGRTEYDEVNAMKQYAIDKGVPSEDIFMDHAGFSTYESMYRARDIFEAKDIIIVTQTYHLYRSVYIAENLGLTACGVSSDKQPYVRQKYYTAREVLARNKDFVKVIFAPEPTYLGEVIPISGSGDLTNDKEFRV